MYIHMYVYIYIYIYIYTHGHPKREAFAPDGRQRALLGIINMYSTILY